MDYYKIFSIHLDNETWKDISGFEGYYQVSDLGRIKSVDRVIRRGENGPLIKYKQKILKQTFHEHGYLYVSFSKNCIPYSFSVHRLVALAFIENPEGKPDVNHKDWIRHNNIKTNLEWSTEVENVSYSYSKPGFINKRKGMNMNKKAKPIYCITSNTHFPSIRRASKELKIPKTSIADVLEKRHTHTHGLVFIYCP